MALGWESVPIWLGPIVWRSQIFGPVETWVGAPISGGQTCCKIGVPTRTDFILFLSPPICFGDGDGTREPGKAEALQPCLQGGLWTRRQPDMSWALWLYYGDPEPSSPVTSARAALGRRGSSQPPLLQAMSTIPKASLFKPPHPGPGYPRKAQVYGGRESS